ncbi:Venom allergen 5 [Armadillidium nasatum]|uniref:Venom allergen 5 n=1 Tax=Armadillidium nasatum TaxID=96803 RepID=A0A5N5SJE4_9CRUS|nr:Venom allergen 5 [Armadillidium nasatum]
MKFLSFIILILNIVGIFSLRCTPCDRSKCPNNIEDKCPWGVGPPYACTCCDACLKGARGELRRYLAYGRILCRRSGMRATPWQER